MIHARDWLRLPLMKIRRDDLSSSSVKLRAVFKSSAETFKKQLPPRQSQPRVRRSSTSASDEFTEGARFFFLAATTGGHSALASDEDLGYRKLSSRFSSASLPT